MEVNRYDFVIVLIVVVNAVVCCASPVISHAVLVDFALALFVPSLLYRGNCGDADSACLFLERRLSRNSCYFKGIVFQSNFPRVDAMID